MEQPRLLAPGATPRERQRIAPAGPALFGQMLAELDCLSALRRSRASLRSLVYHRNRAATGGQVHALSPRGLGCAQAADRPVLLGAICAAVRGAARQRFRASSPTCLPRPMSRSSGSVRNTIWKRPCDCLSARISGLGLQPEMRDALDRFAGSPARPSTSWCSRRKSWSRPVRRETAAGGARRLEAGRGPLPRRDGSGLRAHGVGGHQRRAGLRPEDHSGLPGENGEHRQGPHALPSRRSWSRPCRRCWSG